MKKDIIEHNKLVRDLIPKIIENSNKKYSIHVADENEYRSKLYSKLEEEVDEFLEKPCAEEIADILEVIASIIELNEYYDVDKIKADKNTRRGSFKKRIILDSVWSEE
jgi:predicted house-cleaning noncanonical NTP pyrophosphatase (MazG superfamily)